MESKDKLYKALWGQLATLDQNCKALHHNIMGIEQMNAKTESLASTFSAL
jgi:hypothetical protein